MAILYFGGFDRFKLSSTPVTLPANRASIPFPIWKGIRTRINALASGYCVVQLPNINDSSVLRNWLEIRSTNPSASLTKQYCELAFASTDIPQEYRQVDNVICFGFRIRSNNVTNPHRYISFTKMTATQDLNTGIGGLTATTLYPLEANSMHPLTNRNTQEKYVEYRVRYRENNVCLIKIFVNKDLVHTEELGWEVPWAILAGSPRNSAHWRVSQASGSSTPGATYLNDIYMSLDKPGDKITTGMMGPVTAKMLQLEEPEIQGDWEPSNPAKTIKQVLTEPLINQSTQVGGDYVITDPGDKEAHFRFRAPLEEKLKIVGFQQGFVAQQPLAYSTSLQYAQTANGKSIEEDGGKVTINVALEPSFSHVRMEAISTQPDGSELTPEFIGSLGVKINSTKKLIIDDEDEVEEDIIPEE